MAAKEQKGKEGGWPTIKPSTKTWHVNHYLTIYPENSRSVRFYVQTLRPSQQYLAVRWQVAVSFSVFFTFDHLSTDLTMALEEKGTRKKDIPRDTMIERFLCLLTG